MLVLFAASGVILLGIVVAVLLLVGGGGKSGEDAATDTMKAAGCTVQNVTATSRKHVTSLSAKVKYNTNPPSNGSHYFSPAIWDFYTEPAKPLQVSTTWSTAASSSGGETRFRQPRSSGCAPSTTRARTRMVGTPLPSLGNKVAITAWTAPAGGTGTGHAAVCTSFDEDAFATFRGRVPGRGPGRFPVEGPAARNVARRSERDILRSAGVAKLVIRG